MKPSVTRWMLLGFCVWLPEGAFAAPQVPVAEPFGKTQDGVAVEAFTLRNAKGMRLRAISYGATVVNLETPDRTGKSEDIALGFRSLEGYEKRSPYFGAIVGRFANRIAGGKFALDGQSYSLALNNGAGPWRCSLHGGLRGFDKVVWKGEGLVEGGSQGVRFRYRSRDGEEGYPGNLEVSVTYWLSDANEWRVTYEARTDKATPLNVSQHTYFNLRGEGRGDVMGHELKLQASRFTPVNQGMIPTGEVRSVVGTPLDFTKPVAFGARIDAHDEQLRLGKGYDHNFVLDRKWWSWGRLRQAASVYEPTTGRVMDVFTTEPGIQLYTGNFLDGTLRGKNGGRYVWRGGFCLETQHYPDSPNQPHFPSSIVRPGQVYRSETVFRFAAR